MLYSYLYYTQFLYLIQYISENSKGPYIPMAKARGFTGLCDNEEGVLISENIYAILSIGKKRDYVSSEQKEPPRSCNSGGSS